MTSGNYYGFECQEMIPELLPQIGIPHKSQKCAHAKDWFWWASRFEDHTLGIDCWLTLSLVEIAVDFTIISGEELVKEKTEIAFGRGVIPVFLAQSMLQRANLGNEQALQEFNVEIRTQVSLKAPLLNGNRMTREKAAQLKVATGHTVLNPVRPQIITAKFGPRVRVARYY